MLISEFARRTGLTIDTVRFYVRAGLLQPETSAKGGGKRYRIFTAVHIQAAQIIRTAQSLGMSLKKIATLSEEWRGGQMTCSPERFIVLNSQIKLSYHSHIFTNESPRARPSSDAR